MSTATLIRPHGTAGARRHLEQMDTDTSSSAATLRVFQPEDADDSRTTDTPVRWNDREFEQAPRSVLRRVLLTVVRDPAQRGPMTRELFPMMLNGTPGKSPTGL